MRGSVGGQEPDERQEQHARIEPVRVVRLCERLLLLAPAPLEHLRRDLVPDRAPAFDRSLAAELLDVAHGAVERDPRHHLRVREVTLGPAYLPDARVRSSPARLEPLDQLELQRPDLVVRNAAADAGLVERVPELSVDVELELLRGGVADAHRRRALVAGEPVELELLEPALARDPVHDLHVVGVAGDRAQQPLAPGQRLVPVARLEHREQRQRRVAEPAEAVVPVAHAADVLRQRRRRRRDDAAGRPVGQRLQDEQRLVDLVVIEAVVAARRRPLVPVVLGVVERLLRVDLVGQRACEGNQVSTNGTRSPGRERRTPRRWSCPRRAVSTGVRKQSASGPATATRAWSTRRTQGTIEP